MHKQKVQTLSEKVKKYRIEKKLHCEITKNKIEKAGRLAYGTSP